MTLTKQTWLVAVLAAALVASLVAASQVVASIWYLWRYTEVWGQMGLSGEYRG